MFKVGDKVRIKDNLREIDGFSGGYVSELDRYIGDVVTIERIDEDEVFVEENGWAWDLRAFEKIGGNMEFKIGDRVKGYHGLGRIIAIKDTGSIGVEHDKYMDGHNCYCGIAKGHSGKNGYCWWYAKNSLEKVGDNMKKEDLKNNDIVTLRNGDRLLYFNGDFYNLGEGCCHYIDDLDDYEDDLRTWDRDCKEYDIVKVERPVKYETVFEREEEVQELTVDEISERLGYKVKVVGEDR